MGERSYQGVLVSQQIPKSAIPYSNGKIDSKLIWNFELCICEQLLIRIENNVFFFIVLEKIKLIIQRADKLIGSIIINCKSFTKIK